MKRIFLLMLCISACSDKQDSDEKESAAPDESEVVVSIDDGKRLYTSCVACHGGNGEGNKALQSPAIAGQEAWYLERQLRNFQKGIRGSHEDDTYGKQMAPMAATLATDGDIRNVAAYIASLPIAGREGSIDGDISRGETSYNMVCQACHATGGKGNEALNAPSLLIADDWYLTRQYRNFQNGIRGTHPDDTFGAQMAMMSNALPSEDDIYNIMAYLNSL